MPGPEAGAGALNWRWVPVAVFLAALLVLGRAWAPQAVEVAAHAGLWGVAAYVVFYAVATGTVLPAAPFALASGLLFGWAGLVVAMGCGTAGAALGFALSRTLLRARVARMMAARPVWAAVDRAIAAQGWRVVCLMRISPLLPFNVQSFVFGATRVRFWPYVAATVAGIAPNTVVYVYLGVVGRQSSAGFGWAGWALPAVGVGCAALAAMLVARAARRALIEGSM